MGKPSMFRRKAPPPPEKAAKYAVKDFLFVPEIAYLGGVDPSHMQLIIHQAKLRPYMFESKDGKAVPAYLTMKVKKLLAARGRIVPGFNEGLATERQWLDIIDSALEKPLDKDWYFQPVRPDPLVRVEDEDATPILQKISAALAMDDAPSEILRYIADVINDDTCKMPIRREIF